MFVSLILSFWFLLTNSSSHLLNFFTSTLFSRCFYRLNTFFIHSIYFVGFSSCSSRFTSDLEKRCHAHHFFFLWADSVFCSVFFLSLCLFFSSCFSGYEFFLFSVLHPTNFKNWSSARKKGRFEEFDCLKSSTWKILKRWPLTLVSLFDTQKVSERRNSTGSRRFFKVSWNF